MKRQSVIERHIEGGISGTHVAKLPSNGILSEGESKQHGWRASA